MLRTAGPLGLGRPGGASTAGERPRPMLDHDESQSGPFAERLLARSLDCQRMQRTPHQRTVAALGTWGEVKASPLPHPLHSARLRAGRWIGRLAEQGSTRAQGACLTPVGQNPCRRRWKPWAR